MPCIIIGLYNAPQLIPFQNKTIKDICTKDLKGVAIPYNALGSTPVFKGIELGVPIYAIKENQSILDVTKSNLNLDQIIEIEKYDDL